MLRVYSNAVLLLCGSKTVLVSIDTGVDGDTECRTLGAGVVVPDCNGTLRVEVIVVVSGEAVVFGAVVVFGACGIASIRFN